LVLVLLFGVYQVSAQSVITYEISEGSFAPGEVVEITGKAEGVAANQPVAIEIKDPNGNTILIRTVKVDSEGNFSLKFKIPQSAAVGNYEIITTAEVAGDTITETKIIESAEAEPEPEPVPEERAGGCLIATATFGTELAPQVQQLRELRDNTLLQTESGTSFMTGFNEFYYLFSPTIADLERENPVFKETVKLVITPLIISLSILNYVNIDSESEVLGYGISLILLNIGMYFVLPAIVIHRVRKFV